MLVSAVEMLQAAYRGGYAVGAFNVNNLEFLQGILGAAEDEKAPVMIQISEGAAQYMGLAAAAAMCRTMAQAARVPVALHLDHGGSLEMVVRALAAGFTSVMIDSSRLPLADNIAVTKQVLVVARAVGASVEAEIGRIGGTEDNVTVASWEASLAIPDEVQEFYEQCKVDCLAVAVGSAHGHYHGEPKLDFDRLAEVHRRIDVPLVLHGGSGIPDPAVRRAIELGVSKVNVNTENQEAFTKTIRDQLAEHESLYDPRKYLGPARESIRATVRGKISLFGSSGKA